MLSPEEEALSLVPRGSHRPVHWATLAPHAGYRADAAADVGSPGTQRRACREVGGACGTAARGTGEGHGH